MMEEGALIQSGEMRSGSNFRKGQMVAAFTDSMNNIIRVVKSYKTQSVAGGLGTGGNMAVQGGAAAMEAYLKYVSIGVTPKVA